MRASRTAAAAALAAVAFALTGCSLIGGKDDTADEGTDVFTLAVGDCLDISNLGEEVGSVPTLPCTQPHEAEVYASTNLPEGDYPGDDAVDTSADEYCLGEFEAFVGMSFEESSLWYDFLKPTSGSWEQGDREVLCIAYEADESSTIVLQTGTLKGANR